MKLSVVVPCYNEALNIPLILQRFAAVIHRPDVEVILVDNGSTDRSAQVLQELIPRYPFAKTVRVPENQGYGYGILEGLKLAQGTWVGWTHADMQTDPQDVIKALELAQKAAGPYVFVKGSRKGRCVFDNLFTWGMGVFETFLLKTWLWDINAQPNIFSRHLLDTWTHPPFDFSLDLFALYQAKKQGYSIIRFPVLFPKRVHGQSHWNTGLEAKWKFIKRTLAFSFQLKKELDK